MDYETDDGSQFSLREVWDERDGQSTFAYTSVSAYVDCSAYVGKLDARLDEVDGDILSCLTPVPPECIHPLAPEGLTIAPAINPAMHYLKAPSFTYDDCQPGKTFVADCVLNEVAALERLKLHPHANIVTYLGCVVTDGRITGVCLERYPSSLEAEAERGFNEQQKENIMCDLQDGMDHLFGLGLAHNDINPGNVCLDATGHAILVDFDGCLPIGEKLMKGTSKASDPETGAPLSSRENDMITGLGSIWDFMDDHPTG